MAMGSLSPIERWTPLYNGAVSPGCLLYTYLSGTSTPHPVYNNADLDPSHAHTNPVVADANGTFPVLYLDAVSYRFTVTTSTGTTIFAAQDNIYDYAQLNQSSVVNISGTAGQTLTAEDCCYIDSSGVWRKADSDALASSIDSDVAFAIDAITSGETGLFRAAGNFEYTRAALTPGSTYYVSGTAGDITTTAPTQYPRRIGVADSATSLIVSPNPPGKNPALQSPRIYTAIVSPMTLWCQGRLTLTTGTPVTTGDVTAATSLFFTPYAGSALSLFDGTNWTTKTFTQVTLAVPATTDTMYDIFAYDNAGTLTLELTAWTNDTTRATALTTQDGIYVKSGATTRRYLGSFRTTGVSGQTEDSFAKRYLWNYYNRVQRCGRVTEATNSWNSTNANPHQANGSAANQLDFVIGVAEVAVTADVYGACANNSAAAGAIRVGIGEDSTSAYASGCTFLPANFDTNATITIFPIGAHLQKYPAVGRHYYPWLEQAAGSGTTTFYGDGGVSDLNQGIFGWVMG